MALRFIPMTPNYAVEILNWRYASPYDFYNTSLADIEPGIATMLDPAYHYFVICDDVGDIVAFCCCGDDAQVPGGDYQAPALDIGLGIRPDLTGRGNGSGYFAAICNFAIQHWHPRLLRLTVAAFNQRATRVYEKAGFQRTQAFQRIGDAVNFLVLTMPLASQHV